MTCDPPWEAAEQRRESKQSRAAGEPGALELVHDPRGPQLPPRHPGGQTAKRRGPDKEGRCWCPRPVCPPLSRDRPSPDQLTSQTNEAMWPDSLSTDPP